MECSRGGCGIGRRSLDLRELAMALAEEAWISVEVAVALAEDVWDLNWHVVVVLCTLHY